MSRKFLVAGQISLLNTLHVDFSPLNEFTQIFEKG